VPTPSEMPRWKGRPLTPPSPLRQGFGVKRRKVSMTDPPQAFCIYAWWDSLCRTTVPVGAALVPYRYALAP
jgi:hypothetical protein